MNRNFTSILVLILVCLVLAFLTSCGGSGSSKTPPPPPLTITATSGSGQTATVGEAFTKMLVATVTSNGTAASRVTVTFTPVLADELEVHGVSSRCDLGPLGFEQLQTAADVDHEVHLAQGILSSTDRVRGSDLVAEKSVDALVTDAVKAGAIVTNSGDLKRATIGSDRNPARSARRHRFRSSARNSAARLASPIAVGRRLRRDEGSLHKAPSCHPPHSRRPRMAHHESWN